MKKIICLISLLVAVFNCYAGFFMGTQLGLNVATLKKTSYTINSKIGWHGGYYISIPISDHVSIMPAILYSQRGFKYNRSTIETTTVNPDTTTTIHYTESVNSVLGYLEFPVLLTIFSGESKGLMLQAGPQYSYLISNTTALTSSSTISTNGGASQPTSPSTSSKLEFNKSDISLVGGLGFRFPKLLMVYSRISTGFLKVQKGTLVKDEDSGRNFGVEIGAALTF